MSNLSFLIIYKQKWFAHYDCDSVTDLCGKVCIYIEKAEEVSRRARLTFGRVEIGRLTRWLGSR